MEELENDLDQQVIRTKIAQESEMAIRERYTKAKKGYLELSHNKQVSGKLATEQHTRIKYLERQNERQLAALAGFQLRINEYEEGDANLRNNSVEDIIKSKDATIDAQKKNINDLDSKLKLLEQKLAASKRLSDTKTKASNSTREDGDTFWRGRVEDGEFYAIKPSPSGLP